MLEPVPQRMVTGSCGSLCCSEAPSMGNCLGAASAATDKAVNKTEALTSIFDKQICRIYGKGRRERCLNGYKIQRGMCSRGQAGSIICAKGLAWPITQGLFEWGLPGLGSSWWEKKNATGKVHAMGFPCPTGHMACSWSKELVPNVVDRGTLLPWVELRIGRMSMANIQQESSISHV